MEGLDQQVQEHRAVLPDRIHHHRIAELGCDLAQDVDALGLEPVQVGERVGIWRHCADFLVSVGLHRLWHILVVKRLRTAKKWGSRWVRTCRNPANAASRTLRRHDTETPTPK